MENNSAIAPSVPAPAKQDPSFAHIIVLGNEKGGSGKSTTAMHVAIGLMRLGYKVGTIDLDARQGTLSRYLKNRFAFVNDHKQQIPSPAHMPIQRSRAEGSADQQMEERAQLFGALDELGQANDFIVIDTPGTNNFLSRLAHSYADTLITPMNDSFVDMDLLADIDPTTHDILGASVYTKMVSAQRTHKHLRNKRKINWMVMRTRLSHINAKNKEEIGTLLERLATRFDFELVPGFGDRVIFKELFLKGLTLLDIKGDYEIPLTMSQIAARQEVRNLLKAIDPAKLRGQVRPPRENAI